MDWDNLRVFEAILRTGSLSKAGKVLGMSQPTVGRRLSELEDQLGGLLFERTAEGCMPAPRGQSLAPLVSQMRRAADGVQNVAQIQHRDLSGVVRIAAGELIGRVLARNASHLVEGASGIQLEILPSQEFVNLERGDADLALRTRKPTSDNLTYRPMGEGAFALYASQDYVLARPEAQDAEQRIHGCRWVGFDDGHQHLASATWMRRHLGRAPAIRFSSANLILEAVAHGAGIGAFPILVGDDDTRLVRLSEEPLPLSLASYLVGHVRSRNVPRIRWISTRIVSTLSDKRRLTLNTD